VVSGDALRLTGKDAGVGPTNLYLQSLQQSSAGGKDTSPLPAITTLELGEADDMTLRLLLDAKDEKKGGGESDSLLARLRGAALRQHQFPQLDGSAGPQQCGAKLPEAGDRFTHRIALAGVGDHRLPQLLQRLRAKALQQRTTLIAACSVNLSGGSSLSMADMLSAASR
jgi:hypothetical protein